MKIKQLIWRLKCRLFKYDTHPYITYGKGGENHRLYQCKDCGNIDPYLAVVRKKYGGGAIVSTKFVCRGCGGSNYTTFIG